MAEVMDTFPIMPGTQKRDERRVYQTLLGHCNQSFNEIVRSCILCQKHSLNSVTNGRTVESLEVSFK
jgi:hypothetical protein